ncbi:MAG: nucleotidyl transferase AbiEii/AbiGii toxin family protein [Deltaproteobacteria bacterium]|nr:nucleotidyl transferase AbiEii/AbiGii toxin family protein [Deltaproteobacteria bacterium]
MAPDFYQHILPKAQQIIWPYLEQVPSDFVLYGGTAVALRFGHRTSVDFDFFSNTYPVDKLMKLVLNFKFGTSELESAAKRRNTNHLDLIIYVNDLKIENEIDKSVKLTFLTDKALVPGCLEEPDIHPDNNIKIASPIDLFSHKIWASAQRNKIEDFIDIIEFLKQGYGLEEAFVGCLAFANKSKVSWNINLQNLLNNYQSNTIKQLFSDEEDWKLLSEAAKKVDLKKVFKSKIFVFDQLYDIKNEPPSEDKFQYNKKNGLSFEEFALSLVWTRGSDIPKDKYKFLAFVMAQWPTYYYELVEYYGITDDDFIIALSKAEPGVFRYEISWKLWHQKFKISPIPPFPVKYAYIN